MTASSLGRTRIRSAGSTSANHGSGTVQLADTMCVADSPSSATAASARDRTADSSVASAAERRIGASLVRNPTSAAAARGRVSSGQTSVFGPTGSPPVPPGPSASSTSAGPSSGVPSARSPGSSRDGTANCARRHTSRSRRPASTTGTAPRASPARTRAANGAFNAPNGS